jgi:hypothetical protein
MSVSRPHFLAIALAMGLAACSSPKTVERESPKLFERIRQQQKAMTVYASDSTAAKLGNKSSTGWFQRKKFPTNDYAAQKSFGGASKEFGGVHDYKTKSFSQADKTSHFATQESKFGTKDNRMGAQSYATKDSRYSSKVASQDDKMYRDKDRAYKTGEFAPAKKSLNDNKRIMYEWGEKGDERNVNAYSESQVQHLLGR